MVTCIQMPDLGTRPLPAGSLRKSTKKFIQNNFMIKGSSTLQFLLKGDKLVIRKTHSEIVPICDINLVFCDINCTLPLYHWRSTWTRFFVSVSWHCRLNYCYCCWWGWGVCLPAANHRRQKTTVELPAIQRGPLHPANPD